ncbi:Nudix hydrolase 2, putative [Trypanosoma equiperdum]|uniref:NUDIX hydrolase, conserved n=3 Tax=Trypanozoon TaxID=39700 RepID=Q57Z14_TRYB2|nr:NUDIX hydrolase, conserved [Trypanosoma brucei brucei TREU927]AAX80585.1 NUDIX hydrolase, conserved [Trypanosoma brucei]AAZ11546.1 NUDIX hydrolase, conserved [Trypanosoma brucei brucei TREU927]RHW72412.1 Nudix hydrolase 2 [Trypanosoma brucei equiperdum]SCU70517.1 Nudix hydrolase 2, putative [Trypanosoma equiperdum]
MYRKNVCVVIFNEDLNFLACQRIHEDKFQFVQGGVEEGDADIIRAAYREVHEEVGLFPEDLRLIGEIMPPSGDPHEFRYILHEGANLRHFGYVGQQQRLFLFYTPSSTIQRVRLVPPKGSVAKQEFSHVEWLPIDEIIERCPKEKQHIFVAVSKVAIPMAKAFLKTRSSI